MAFSLVRTLEDGATVVRDDDDGREFALKPGQWEQIKVTAPDMQRVLADYLIAQNQADLHGVSRTQAEEEAIQTYQNTTSGERHQDEGRQ